MPRRMHDLTPHREQIATLICLRFTSYDIRSLLESEHGIVIAQRSYQRQIREMGLYVNERHQKASSPELSQRLRELYRRCLPDVEINRILREEGFCVNERHVGRLRRELGLLKRCVGSKAAEMDSYVKEVVRRELGEDGSLTEGGRTAVYGRMREKYDVVGRHRMTRAIKELDPQWNEGSSEARTGDEITGVPSNANA